MTVSESLTRFPVNELQSVSLAETYYRHILGQNHKVMNRTIDYDTSKPHYKMTAFEIGVSENFTALCVN